MKTFYFIISEETTDLVDKVFYINASKLTGMIPRYKQLPNANVYYLADVSIPRQLVVGHLSTALNELLRKGEL